MICITPEESSLTKKDCFFNFNHISSGNKHIRKLYDSKLKNNCRKYKSPKERIMGLWVIRHYFLAKNNRDRHDSACKQNGGGGDLAQD